jgi:hypothetical protein
MRAKKPKGKGKGKGKGKPSSKCPKVSKIIDMAAEKYECRLIVENNYFYHLFICNR